MGFTSSLHARFSRFVGVTFISLVFALSANAQHPTMNIVETAVAADDFTLLVAALEATGLDAALADEHARFTVFAPTDAAFEALGVDTLKSLLSNPETLADILLYHVLDRRKPSFALLWQNGRDLTTLNGDSIRVTANGWHNLFVNESKLVVKDIRATNGVIHVIDKVLIPPIDDPAPDAELNIVQTAIEAGGFDTLVAALQATGLDEALANPEGNFTVFAPTDEAFDALGADTINALLSDPDTLSDILLYHVVGSERTEEQLLRRNGRALRTLNTDRIVINLTDDGLYINQSLVDVTDIQTTNGVIHVIDRVLLPPTDSVVEGTIVDVAVANGSFTTLVTALQATGLDRVLANPHYQFTVFAPTDAAFAELGDEAIADLLANPSVLADILLYHVTGRSKQSTRLLKGVQRGIRMLNWDRVALDIRDGDLFVNESKIVVQDIVTENGVIHVIDAVLLPPSH